mgnify:CR=1 FL=1
MFAWRDNFIGFSTGGDPYWNNVSLLQNFESPATAYTDSSTNNFRITPNGAPRPNSRTPFASGDGASMYWDGNASWLHMPADSAWSLGTGNFTFEAWVYVTNFSVNFGGYMPIVSWGGGSFKTFRVRPTAMNFQSPNISADYNALWPSTMVINTWYHVALVRTSTTSVRAYLNGVGGTAVTISASAQFGNATDLLQVGYKSDPGYWWGYISNWRLVKGTAVYTSNFTPSTTPLTAISGTSGLLNFTNSGFFNTNSAVLPASGTSVIDYSIYAGTITNTNTVLYAGLSPFTNAYPGSLQFLSASARYLTRATNAIFTYASGDFTIEGWFRFTSVGTTQYLIDQRNSGTATAIIPTLYLDSTNVIIYYVNGAARITGTGAITTNTWYHIAVSRSGTSTKLFVNGTQDGSTYSDTNNYAASRVSIGSAGNAAGSYLNGYASSIRLSKGFAYYTANFTPSTIPLTASATYTSLLINPSMGGYQDLSNYGQASTSTTTNNVVSTAQKKFGTQSISFVATGSQTISNTTELQFGTGDFTIECWVYRNVALATHSIICKGAAATGWLLQINASNQLVWTATSTALKTSTTTIPATTWTFVTITRSGTTGYMFINGTLEGSGYSDTTNYNQTTNLVIGADRSGANGFNGYMDDIRVTTGVCRYTATFAAPTDTFPTS